MSDCTYGKTCYNFHCTRAHPAGRAGKCKFAATCHRFGCTYLHPSERPHDCNFGAACTRAGCKFLHPSKPGAAAAAAAPAAAAAAAPAAAAPAGPLKVINNGATKQLSMVKDGKKETLKIETVRSSTLAFNASVDASGSMAGGLTEEAIRGLKVIFDTAMRNTDLFGCQTFNTEVRNLHHLLPKAKVTFDNDAKNIRANNGGSTALYDAIKAGIAELKTSIDMQAKAGHGKPTPIQLVITDGGDNASKTSLDEIVDLVAKHNKWKGYHLFVVAVGITPDVAATMRRICAPKHATFMHARDCAEMKSMLGTVADKIRIVMESTDGDETMRFEVVSSNPDTLAKSLQQMAIGSKLLADRKSVV